MGNKTGITWTKSTWNPLRGCSKVSAGCRGCYAETMAARFSGPGQAYEGTIRDGRWNGEIRLVPEALDQPLRWQRPRMVFVNSMSDLWHEKVEFDFIDNVFGVMAVAERHTFQVLTKRPGRALEYMTRPRLLQPVEVDVAQSGEFQARLSNVLPGFTWDGRGSEAHLYPPGAAARVKNRRAWPGWPLPNVWLGTSVENQAAADERIPVLQQVPAAIRFLSIEPMIGPVNLSGLLDGIGWVIVGGESGPGARPMSLDWAARVRDQCADAGVPYFFKQLGSVTAQAMGLGGKGHDPAEWPEGFTQAFPPMAAG